ncbi:MAG: hypothetical protein HUU06_05110 [Planctomycetaceae bacterium]|nr:hypothetical protein [Planctomycetota bacterium]NUN52152.1 hypothetical protein [Planctomycetaceae bacterium]
MRRRFVGLALVALLALPLAGCFPKTLLQSVIFVVYYKLITTGSPYKAKASSSSTDVDVLVDAEVGGTSGTYDVTLYDNESEDTFGTFTGETTLKKGRFITIKDNGSEGLLSTVENMVSKSLGGAAVSITKAKAKVTANQEPGGVAATFKATVKFTGTVDSGPSTGAKIKGGKITAGHTWDFE